MLRRVTIVMALAVGALCTTLAIPAHADSVQEKCQVNPVTQLSGDDLRVKGYYTPVSAQARRWTKITYVISETLVQGGPTGNQSNVNLTLVERDYEERWFGGEVIIVPVSKVRYSYESPDNRKRRVNYNLYPNVLTNTRDRYGHPNDIIRFEGIFDWRFIPDPRCSDSTDPV